ncbi:MAG TPA: sigma-70 region 4 domain-containing protein [Solirubrobacteraceae bacterium]|jgi:hypothetical protein|nr:sigma-70 region 4 domain-containing protein [Solirubrobacteraceae bacterium]
MSRVDELPPDQRATLSLLLQQGKSYAQVAAMLAIPEQAVHDRAHAALAMLAPLLARELTPEQRLAIGDYLLGAQPIAERLRTRAAIAGSEPAHAWAEELAAQLAPLAGANLPDIPPPAQTVAGASAAGAAPAPSPPAAGELGPSPSAQAAVAAVKAAAGAGGATGAHAAGAQGGASPPGHGAGGRGGSGGARSSPRSSRLGGAVLLAAFVAAAIVGVVLSVGGGSGSNKTTSTSTTSASSGKEPVLESENPILPPNPKTSKAVGVIDVVSREGTRYLLIEARNLKPPKGFYYAIWLYNSPTSELAVTETSEIKNHTLGGLTRLPAGAGQYHEILLTQETDPRPSGPGTIVLHGRFTLHGTSSASPDS